MSERYQKSRELLERAKQSLAGGVSSPFRAMFPVQLDFAGEFDSALGPARERVGGIVHGRTAA